VNSIRSAFTAKPKKVAIEQSTLDFYIAESQAIHALCDRAEVPQELGDGIGLSMSQRVAILEGAYRRMVAKNNGSELPLEH
jgi:hypothetical protein